MSHPVPPAADVHSAERPRHHEASEYADLMPVLRRYAGLPPGSVERSRLRSELVAAFLPVVRHVVQRYSYGHRSDREDLEQTGAVALINAIDRWDPARARGEFLGYLIPSVRGELLRYYRDRTWAVRVPRRIKDITVAITRLSGPLTLELGRAPRPSELAARLGLDREEVLEALSAMGQRDTVSLDPPTGDGGPAVLDIVGTRDAGIDRVEHRECLRPLITRLPERERSILEMRFFAEMTQSQIAERWGISQMHVSRLLAATLARLREELAAASREADVAPACA